jgi:anti-anti-sigma regulatory factor
MFRVAPTPIMDYHMENISPLTVRIRLTNPEWQYARLPNLTQRLSGSLYSQVILDLASVQHMTSASLALLITLKSKLQREGLRVCIQGLQSQPKSLCEVLRLNHLLLGNLYHSPTKEILANKK